ncbi:dephospho-CoA kinase [Hydrogenophaga taeniospiralis]|uniref:dephospho-CoA kinase n=1 Tax=Hydrogenophaga taeniospiralis TaxID=65656 RepID=UPI0008B21F9E|nr:dephospho-CoA kinase [Hydrogenophaga taeniospiralis]OGB19256.1 MAG: dephospho-CoA kinase [Burkholderiales bacterium RIFCSPLOWO2_02_FULL_67_64]OGB42347.1 MAG: dephospho-CoA kinase [Burkholderiales bacterium RIFCSPLOWO2_12_67_14]OGB42494.1 MAG: dephospho-CoA kinase [Burkholderiales bacterium RIFCSPHIGHO2_12_FULL_67_38]OGB79112.1 MAG: dephospho-CoA kinase [Burkholderiales bacterium RIFCSPLOWO2_12_FULL_67_210]MCB4364067.1 dephospho-CoA kinase [Hydrogenophaga taeniospiralis]
MTARTILRLGLTGGIGSGKSTVAHLLKDRGASVIDADAISRACTLENGSAIPAIAQTFGQDFITPDGALDRPRMRDHVFTHPEARQALEAIVHPLVRAEIRRLAAASSSPCLVFDVPLLVESAEWRQQLDRVLVVDCSEETQIRRVTERNGWDRDTIEAVLRSQCPRAQRLLAADMVIFNDGYQIEPLRRLVGLLADEFGL